VQVIEPTSAVCRRSAAGIFTAIGMKLTSAAEAANQKESGLRHA